MAYFPRWRSFRQIIIPLFGFAMLLLHDRVSAGPPESDEFIEPAGLVWFIGTVEQVVDGAATIDLGEVHTLRQGSRVAAVRYRDSHFAPLGVLEVQYSYPTWCQMSQSKSIVSEVGDLVMFVEAPGDLGSGDAIRDSFIRHRIVSNANRNSYSTMRDSVEANSLQQMIEKQRRWIEGNRKVAGIVRSPSVTSETLDRLKLFMTQIMTFQDYQNQGVNVSLVTSESWSELLDELRRRYDSNETNPFEIDGASVLPAHAIATEQNVGPDKSLAVRHQVDELMFQRSPEERNLVSAICTTLLQTKTANERQWMTQQLAASQFPFFSRQEQMLLDMEAIMRRVRQTE